ncbi:MAG: outer membrane beta-barrel protein [Muribaculaceae bacterium]|nr:outer membrane beta-barrel protein [Muribaculaceae bacterium]
MLRILFLFVLASLMLPVNSRSIELAGRVTDQKDNPLEFAVVAVRNCTDSVLTASGLTDAEGCFNISVPDKPSRLIVSLFGYETNVTSLECGSDTVINIVLKESPTLMKEVTVTAHRPVVKLSNEGIVTQIQNTVLSQSGSAIDVLENIPLVMKTSDGFSVFGKGAPVIYIDGRRVYDLSELDGLKSQDIKNVEVITNPGAKYDASVSSVIKISTILKRENTFAIDNRLSAIQSKHTGAIEQLSINYRTGKFEIYDNFKYSTLGQSTVKEGIQDVTADTLWHYTTYETETLRKQSFDNTLSLSLPLNKSHLIGVRYLLSASLPHREGINSNSSITADGLLFDRIHNAGITRTSSNPSHRLNLFYTGNIGKWKIDCDLNFLDRKSSVDSRYDETSELSYNRVVTSTNSIKTRIISSRLIGSVGLFGGELGIGTDYNHTDRFDKYMNHSGIINSSDIRIIENQINLFLEYNRMLPIGLFNAGLRYEHTSTDYTMHNQGAKNFERIFNQFFPGLSFSSKIGNLQWQLGYNTRTLRPKYNQLSSNVMYVNRFTLQTGNPFLRPEYIHDLSLKGLWKFLQFSFEYQDKRNAIIYWPESNPANKSVTTISYKNINSVKRITSILSVFGNIGIWSPRLTLGINRQFLKLMNRSSELSLQKPLCYAQMVNTIKFPLSFNLIINANYQSKGNFQNVYLNKNIFYLDLSLIKSFSKGKYSIQLKVSDLFKTMSDGNTLFSEATVMNLNNYYDSRKFTLTFRYRFNIIKNKDRKNSFVDNELERL